MDLAKSLVSYLQKKFCNTSRRPEWSKRNLEGLNQFAEEQGAVGFYRQKKDGGPGTDHEFLWDFFAGYDPEDLRLGKGALFIAESEHNESSLDDWEKLFYARAPIKILIYRIKSKAHAENKMKKHVSYMRENCTLFNPGEIYILYGVWWAEDEDSSNRDIIYIFQAPGELNFAHVPKPEFKRF